jgi:hypothetical protein
MSYYRNYKRTQHYHDRRRRNNPDDLIKGIMLVGISFILLNSISSLASGNFFPAFIKIVFFVIFLSIIFALINRIKDRNKYTSSTASINSVGESIRQAAVINSEKHSIKCYMEGLTPGEHEVAYRLSQGLSYKDYFIYNNITIPSLNNGSSQIDHLVISTYGIFVLESKDYKGWIFGSQNQEYWTQSLPGGKNKFQFQNPLRQNWSHIMSLKTLMPFIPEKAFYNIAVFTDLCEIKTPIENVVQIENVVDAITKYNENQISENNIHLALGKLSYVCQTADISPDQHIENLQTAHSEN